MGGVGWAKRSLSAGVSEASAILCTIQSRISAQGIMGMREEIAD